YNRHGAAFDVGETFAGLDYETGLEFVAAIRELVPEGATTAQLALRWILMHEGVTAAIPGAKSPAQARANAAATDLPPLPDAVMARVQELYDRYARDLVHQRW
ncbi:MAG TPA: aldo/keto reductase, partial [Anaerolineae bacterium]|nr:aldo/keto reductase [Anaerolineae bacterium]